MSVSSLVLGVLNGLTYGLLAAGLVLVYKSNRFLNLAHAQLGALSALLLAKWVVDWGLSWWVAFVLAVTVGVVAGVAVERLLIRPLRRRGATPVRLLLMSVAASQLLLALTFIPHIGPDLAKVRAYPQPFVSHLSVGHIALTGTAVVTAVLVPVLVIALAVFLRYSFLGRAIRAAANNPDAARLCGISVARASLVTWALAGGFAGVSAILEAPNQTNPSIASLGPYLLMLTLGAAAFGAFVSVPGALAGGVALGLVSQFVSALTSNAADGELAVFCAVLLVVLLRGRAIGRVFAFSGGVTEDLPPATVPESLRSSLLVRYQRAWLAAGAVLVAAAIPKLPYFDTAGHRFLLQLVLIYALLGVGLTMLVGWAGQVSLGHFAVVGLGAYLTARWAPHWSLLPILLLAGLIGAGVMLVTGLPALRVGGLALAVTTMGFAVIAADWLYRQSWAGSNQQFVTIDPLHLGRGLGTTSSQLTLYYVILVVLVVGGAAAVAFRRWGPGRVTIAVRDNEPAASALGIQPATVKLAILAVSGFYAAVAGVLWAQAWRAASPAQFTSDLSIAVVAIPVIGGLGSVSGAVAAAALLYMATFFVGPHLAGLFGNLGHNIGFELFLAGLGQVAVLLAYPRGIAGVAQRGWEWFLRRRAEFVERWSPSLGVQAEGPPELDPIRAAMLTRGEAERPSPPERDLPLLVTEGLKVHFGGRTALDEPNIEVRVGEIVGLIGPNGAGKTTLVNAISGVLRADVGSIRVFGRQVADLPADFRAAYGISRTFQECRLFPGLTVTEAIQVAFDYHAKIGVLAAMCAAPWAQATETATRTTAEGLVDRFGLTPWQDTLTSELSTGTRRICDLAIQVAAAPRLLLLDEPTAGVAQREAEAFGPLLRQLRDELECAILIVEHDMPLLMGLCDRVYAMETGRVISEGSPQDVRSNPAVIASYLGSSEVAVQRSGSRASVNGAGVNGAGVNGGRTRRRRAELPAEIETDQ